MRWWFARDVTEVADTDYTPLRLIARANEDLANGLGNVTNRIVNLVHRLRDGLVADVERRARGRGTRRRGDVAAHLADFDLRGAAGAISAAVTALNQDLEATKPWQRAQHLDPVALDELLARHVVSARHIATGGPTDRAPALRSAPRPARLVAPPPRPGARLRPYRVTSASLPGYGESFALTIRRGPCCEHLAEREATVHIPDGFIDGPTAAAGGAVAVGLVGVSLKMAAKELDDKQVPLAGLTAAFVFAVQMLNFPVAAGTSGHLLGGCLAAVLVGPWVAMVCMTVVLGVQALVFADGGLSALGLNVILMGAVTCFVGYATFVSGAVSCPPRRLRSPRRRASPRGAR